VRLYAEVVGDDVEPLLADRRDLVTLPRSRAAREVEPLHGRLLEDLGEERVGVRIGGGDGTAHRPVRADVSGESPRVDIGDPGHTEPREVGVEALLTPPVRRTARRLSHDEAPGARRRGFQILTVHAVVALQRVGHRHQLTRVRWVGEDLLIPGHARVEDDLTKGGSLGTEGGAVEATAVFEEEVGCGCGHGASGRAR